MASLAGVHRYPYTDYLALESSSNVKHEYLSMVWASGKSGWKSEVARSGQVARIMAIGCELDVDALYRDGLPPGSPLAHSARPND